MTKKKKKGLGIFRIFVIILLLVLVAFVLVRIMKTSFSLQKEEKEDNTQIEEAQEENLNNVVHISCNKYDVYFDDDNKLGFNFIIAELDFSCEDGPLHYDLGKFHTAEHSRLDDCEYYFNKLKEYNFDVKKFDLLDEQFSSEGGNLRGNVFIPFYRNVNSMTLYNGGATEFDLTKNSHSINELFYDVQTEDIKTDKYDIAVSNSYMEREFYTGTDEFVCPLGLVFELTVNELSDSNVYIENAKFIPNGALSGFEINLLPNDVNTLKIENIINKKLKVGDKYGLFFQVSEQTNTNGVIMIKFSNNDKWIELSTGELNEE